MIPIFFAKNIKAKIIIQNKDMFDTYLQTLPEEVQITVSKIKKDRSLPQNAYLWSGVYPPLAEHLGYTNEEMHEICKSKFNFEMIHVGKDEVRVVKSTAGLNTISFNKYISDIVIWASLEFGVIITEPLGE